MISRGPTMPQSAWWDWSGGHGGVPPVRALGAVLRTRKAAYDMSPLSVNRELEAKARTLAGIKGYADVVVMPTGGVFLLVGAVRGLVLPA